MKTQSQNSMASQEQKDIIEIKAELGRIRHHQDLQKIVNTDNTTLLIEIRTALIGNEMNGKNGLVSEVKTLEKKIEEQNIKLVQYDVYVNQFKWAVGIFASILVGLMVTIFKKL